MSVTVVDPFLGWLIRQQEQKGESDQQFAARLGMSRPQWANAKSDRRKLNRRAVEVICQRCERSKRAYLTLCLSNYDPDARPPESVPGG